MIDLARARELIRTKGPSFALEVGINVVLPFAIYSLAEHRYGEVLALIASSAPPMIWSLVEFIRHRKLDAVSLLVLAGIVLSLLAFFGGGGARMLQLREKLVTGLIGVAFLISAAIRRPLMYELARAGMARNGATAEAQRMQRLKDDPIFRRAMTVMTVVWGFGLILDVAIASALVFTLSIKQYLIVSSIEGYGVLGAIVAWTFWYARRSRAKGEAARAAAKLGSPEHESPESGQP